MFWENMTSNKFNIFINHAKVLILQIKYLKGQSLFELLSLQHSHKWLLLSILQFYNYVVTVCLWYSS